MESGQPIVLTIKPLVRASTVLCNSFICHAAGLDLLIRVHGVVGCVVTGWQHGVVTSSPVDGQLPSSVDNTPEPAMPSKPHHTSPELTTTAAPASTTFDGCHGAQYQSRAESVTAGSSHKPRQSSEEGLEHSASRKADAAQTLSDEQPPPTVRLSGPSDAPPSAGMRPSSALNSSMQPQQPSHSTSASTREPLRYLPVMPVSRTGYRCGTCLSPLHGLQYPTAVYCLFCATAGRFNHNYLFGQQCRINPKCLINCNWRKQ